MNVSLKTKILVGAAAVIFIIAVICLILFGGKDGDNNPASLENYDITGVWYSDREGGDTLTLEKDGTYTSSKWLAQGNYAVDGNTVTLSDMFGDSKELVLTVADNAYTLQYTGASAHTYYRTEKEVTDAQAAAAAAEEEKQSMYSAALQQILTTGVWESLDATTKMTFTDNAISFEYAGITAGNTSNVGAATTTYSYSVVSFTVENGNYFVVMDFHDNTNNADYKGCNVDVTVSDDNLYTILCHNFPYAYKYTKTVEIDFTQPDGTTGSGNEQDSTDPSSTGDREVIGEDGSTDRITQISRDDNPDDSKQVEAAYKAIEAAIYGTWQGTFEEYERADTVYWQFTFNKDGTYSFNDDSGNNETGTFVLGRNTGEASYISNMTLTPKDGEAYALNFTMTGNPINGLRFDSYGAERSYPTFVIK